MMFANVNWANAQSFFILLISFMIISFLLIRKFIWQKKVAAILEPKGINRKLLMNFSLTRKFIKMLLVMLSMAFLSLALMRPQWNKKEHTIEQTGRDILIAVDISRSMLAQDVHPNRLEFAKQKIKNLVNTLGNDRVGLLIFSGTTFLLCPLTIDIAAFDMFLDSIDVESLSSGTTAIDKAVEKAISIFNDMSSKKSKLLIIFTDGEDFSSDLSNIKQKAKNINLRIFTVGVGTTQGAPIPLFDENGKQVGHQKDENGSIVISHLDETILNSLATESGAVYIRSSEDNKDIKTIIDHVHRFEKEKFEDKKISLLEERYYYFAGISLLLLLIEWLL